MFKCFAKCYVSNSSEEVFVVTKVKNSVFKNNVISDLKGKDIVETLKKNELQKKQQQKKTKT